MKYDRLTPTMENSRQMTLDEVRLQIENERITARLKVMNFMYEEVNHHLDLMVECYGIEALVELVEAEE